MSLARPRPPPQIPAPLRSPALALMTDPLAGLLEALRDRYRVDREVGRGRMATVFRARDPVLA